MGAIARRFGREDLLGEIARGYMSAAHISPLVYWSNVKRAVRPLIDAGGETLRALGLPVEEEPLSCVVIARAIVDVTYQEIPEDDYVIYLGLQRLMGRL